MDKKHILIVDDDPAILRLLSTNLKARGYEILTATDGEESLEAVQKDFVDLIILDLMMPKMDGFGVCKELQDPRWSKFKDTPILILTSVREEASRRRYELETGLELNVDDYIEKPMSPDILLERVKTLINKNKR